MEPSTTIQKMIAGNQISVPSYQRAYSWETPSPLSSRKTHTDVFLSDLEEYSKSGAVSSYYFGHFLFQKKQENEDIYFVIDGQQRMTTILIYISALFYRLKIIRALGDKEKEFYEDIVKRNQTYSDLPSVIRLPREGFHATSLSCC